jgi:hypothetical protein
LISGGGDGVVRAWNYSTGKALCAVDFQAALTGEEGADDKAEVIVENVVSCFKKDAVVIVSLRG